MPKVKISDYSQTAASNTDINSINLGEGMLPSDVNNAIRELMKQLKDFQVGAQGDPVTVGGNLVVSGTSNLVGTATLGVVSGATISGSANTITNVSLTTGVTGTLPVGNGGTGATSFTSGAVLKGSGTSAITTATAGTDYVAPGTSSTFTAAQTFRAANAIRSEAASTQDAIVIAGRAGGTSNRAITLTPASLGASRTATLPDPGADYTVGFRNVPQSGSDKTSSYTLTVDDIGEFVGVGTSGSITIPNSTFAAGDVISIFNNTSGNITITCSITTAYIAGTNTDKDTMTLATRGLATILFISGTVCVVSGNVS